MSHIYVARDPFARGSYRRTPAGEGRCRWCGEERLRLYQYGWDPDGRLWYRGPADGEFCNFQCFRYFYT